MNENKSSQKLKGCVEAHMRFSSNKTVVDLLTVSQTSLHKTGHAKKANSRQSRLYYEND